MSDFAMDRPIMPSPRRKTRRRLAAAILAAALTTACGDADRPPRELPFPVFEPTAPFPELAAARQGEEAGGPGDFERMLGAAGAAPEAAEPAEPQLQSVPLAGPLVGRIPAGEGWRWASAGGVAIVTYAPGAGRPAALIYAESFGSLIQSRPSEEHHRFQVAVDPGLSEGYLDPPSALELAGGGPLRQLAERSGLSRSEAGQLAQLLATRTRGRGLGFQPAAGTFTGWRWVGRNREGLTLRVGRQLGTWADPRPLPERFQQALERLGMGGAGAGPGTSGGSALEVPAALVLGSAAARQEQTGVHFALLCVQAPECPVARELADFLDSLHVGEPGLVERLLAEPPAALEELAYAVGVEIRPAGEAATP